MAWLCMCVTWWWPDATSTRQSSSPRADHSSASDMSVAAARSIAIPPPAKSAVIGRSASGRW